MPPYYPDQYQNQYGDQYQYGAQYNDQYNQYQYSMPSQTHYQQTQQQIQQQTQQQTHQQTPPPRQIQVNIPPRQQQTPQQQQQQHNYNQNYQATYAQQSAPYQYQYQQQHQSQSSYAPQPAQPPLTPVQVQHYQQQHMHRQIQEQQQRLPQQQEQVQRQSHHHQQQQQQQQYQQQQQRKQQQVQQQQQQQQQHRQQNYPQVAPRQQIQVNIPKPQPQPQPHRVLKDVQPTAPKQPQSATSKPPQSLKEDHDPMEPDFDILLLSLADEYLEAAQRLPFRSEEYFRLTALALGCIDAVLNNFKLSPLREAQVSLKYAQLLLNETENYDEAERVLTKIADNCERLKYLDLKYAAQLLLTRVLYQSRPKAALKGLQGMIQDLEAYKHTAWEYTFRFQYVMFAVTSNHASDNHVAISQLERIAHLARQSGDNAVFGFASVLEALIHLQSTSNESVQSSQRSLAKARALQLNPDVEENAQLCIMMEFVDLCGQIKLSDIAQSEQKRKDMQKVLYAALQKDSWRRNGLMYLPIHQSSLHGLPLQDTGLIAQRNGKYVLAFTWLSKTEVEDLGYLLSGISAAQKNAGDGGKAEKFFDEGLAVLKEAMDEDRPTGHIGDTVSGRLQLVQCHFLLELACLQCSKGQWNKAQATIKQVETVAQGFGGEFPREIQCLTDYLKGAICQGKGDLEAALSTFQSPTLSIASQLDDQGSAKPSSQLHRHDDTIRNTSILAALNTIFIIQQPQHPQHQRLSTLINLVDPLASHHPNKNIQAAWNFVLASLPNNTILKTKQYLGHALTTAQGINNAQITALCLVTMQEKFFKGVVGDQAVKCARAATHQAKRLNEPLWIATASGLEAECLSLHGMVEETAKKREEAERAAMVLPEKVRNVALS